MSDKSTDYILYQINCSLDVLNTKLIKISQNNVIAILNTNGVCLMRNDYDPIEASNFKNRQYQKINIKNPSTTFLHDIHKLIKNNLLNFECEESSKINLDHTLLPMNNATIYRGYRTLEWSFGNCLDCEPLFALLSLEHELIIYKFTNYNYESILNVSKILLDNFLKTNKRKYDINYESLKDIIYSTAIINMFWTEFNLEEEKIEEDNLENNTMIIDNDTINRNTNQLNDNQQIKQPIKRSKRLSNKKQLNNESILNQLSNQTESINENHNLSNKNNSSNQINSLNQTKSNQSINQKQIKFKINHICLLVTLSRNGIIYFFKIKHNNENINCLYLNEWRSDLIIKNIYNYQNYLILIYKNGQIELIEFELKDNKIDELNFNFNNLIKQRIFLWNEDDDIEIDDLLIYKKNNLIYVVFTKINYLIVKILESINELNQLDGLNLKIKDTIIEEGIFKMSSTGLCKLYNDNLLLTSLDGNFIKIKINDTINEQEQKIIQNKLNIPTLKKANLCPRSIASTNDGYICCTISLVSIYFDHLELRDSTKLTIFTTLNKNEILDKIINLIQIDNTIEFKNFYNLLECFKVYLMNNEYEFNFLNFINDKNLNNLTELNLKVLRFVLQYEKEINSINSNNLNIFNFKEDAIEQIESEQIMEINKINEEINNNQINEINNENLINDKLNTKINHSKLIKQNSFNQDDYDKLIKQIEIILNKRHFNKFINLDKLNKQNDLNDEQKLSINLINYYLNSKINKTNKNSRSFIKKEQCPICKDNFNLDEYDQLKCLNEHQFTRCCYSLLICDLSKYDYKLCKLCKRTTYIYPFIWSLNTNYCLYCK